MDEGRSDRALGDEAPLGTAALRELYHSVNDAIFVHDAETGDILDVNDTMCDMYGYSRAEARELRIEDVSSGVPPYTQADAMAYVRKAAAGDPQVFDWQAEDSDGNRFWVEVSMRHATIDGDSLVLVIVRDIDERKRQEQELQAAQRRFDAVFNNPIAFMALLDPDGTVTDVNEAALSFVDRTPEDVVGRPFWETPWWSHSAALQADLREWIERASTGELVRYEAEHRSPDGDRVTIDGVLHPIRDDEGAVVSVLAGGRDISERKRRERELERQNERLDEFASIVSHDLRNPLNVAEGHLELARATCESDHLDSVERAHDRMETLIDDLLTLARQGETPTDPSAVDIATIAETSWEYVDTGAATLTVDSTRTVRADRGRLGQLFENLYRNAVEHGGADVTVRVGALDDGFYVEDDGVGIPPDVREDLFDPSAEGSGFGSSIVAAIASAHGWDVTVTESDAGGARFEFTGAA